MAFSFQTESRVARARCLTTRHPLPDARAMTPREHAKRPILRERKPRRRLFGLVSAYFKP